jgi:hypothetical protein
MGITIAALNLFRLQVGTILGIFTLIYLARLEIREYF